MSLRINGVNLLVTVRRILTMGPSVASAVTSVRLPTETSSKLDSKAFYGIRVSTHKFGKFKQRARTGCRMPFRR
jgi:hypothetical protein